MYQFISAGTLPYDFYRGCAVTINDGNGTIYLLGGAGDPDGMYEKDDLNDWSLLGWLPYDFVDGCAFVDKDNQIHILGSSVSGNEKNHYYLNSGGVWVDAGELPYNFYNGYAFCDEYGGITIIGGTESQYSLSSYDPYEQEWGTNSHFSNIPLKDGAGLYDENLGQYLIINNGYFLRYDIGTLYSYTLSELYYPYSFTKGVYVYDPISKKKLLIGGTNTSRVCYAQPEDSYGFEDEGTLPYDFKDGCAVYYKGKIHLLGGSQSMRADYEGGTIYNKVVYGDRVLIDLTEDTLTASKLEAGYTAHDRTGALIMGTGQGGNAQWGSITGTLSNQTDLQTALNTKKNASDMISNSGFVSTMQNLAQDDTDDSLASVYAIANWANCDAKIILTTAAQGTEGVGTWEADGTWDAQGGSRVGWLWSEYLYHVIEDGSSNRNYSVEVIPVFDMGDSETISLYAYRVDDDIDQTIDGQTVHGGAVAFKFNGAVQSANGVKVGVKLVYQRTEIVDTGRIIS